MKTIAKVLTVVLAVIILAASLAACGGSATIVGTWENSEFGTSYVFKADGTGSLSGEGYSLNLTYVDKGSTVDVTYEGAEVQSLDYTVSGNTLTIAGIEYTKK